MKKMKKIFAACLLLAMLVSLLAGCGDSGSSGNGRTITVAFTAATSLSPWGTSNSTPGNYEVYEDLFEVDPEGNVFPVLADGSRGGNNPAGVMGYDHEEGSLVYTVYVWDYITDHNGNKVDAYDVAWSYNYQWKNEIVSGWGVLESVVALDETTVEFTFNKELTGVGEFEQIFTLCFIVSEESYNNSSSQLLSEMVGTGPYKMESYTSNVELTLVRNDDYWQTNDEYRHQAQQANVEKIVYKFMNEAATRILSFKTGEIDLSDDIESKYIAEFDEGGEYSDDYKVFTYPAGLIYNLWLNCSEEALTGDINMRLAIYYAIDTEALVRLMGGDEAGYFLAKSFGNTVKSDYNEDWETSMETYNNYYGSEEERAALVNQYLEAAGYNGEAVRFVYQSDMSEIATAVIGLLNQYGITVEPHGTDHAGATTIKNQADQWEIDFGQWGGDYLVLEWQHAYDWANTTDADHTVNFIYDQEWQSLLELCYTAEGHTDENMERWVEMLYENAYGMNLFNTSKNIIYPSYITSLYRNNKLVILPGACEYED